MRFARTAFFFHAPGLWLLHRYRLGPISRRHNALAIALTLIAMLATYIASRSVAALLVAWGAGHVAWGAWLGARVARNEGER